jgi:hypothetical protein
MKAKHKSQLAGQSKTMASAPRIWPTALALASGLALRLWMLHAIPQVSGDTLLYGGLAKNLLLHGQYAITDGSGVLHTTLLRLPGYPLFLALCFQLFGMENYNAVAYVQIALELLGCLLLADFVRLIAPPNLRNGAALSTLWLSALCPFTASYAVAPLTEAPTLFAISLALWAVARFHAGQGKSLWPSALWFTFAITFAALLRPDGALVGIALVPAMLAGLRLAAPRNSDASEPSKSIAPQTPKASQAGSARSATVQKSTQSSQAAKKLAAKANRKNPASRRDLSSADIPQSQHRPSAPELIRMAIACLLLALLPFGIWAVRNWSVFHVFEPLAPRYATDPGESTNPGWQRWTKTWCLDFVSTYYIYWNVPGSPLDLAKLPSRAFDTPEQYTETAALAAAYADNGQDLSPELDERFAQLADERIKADPMRFYLWLPLGRMGDMWLRPRVENLDIDLDWWVYSHHNAETRFSWAYAGLNAAYLLLALAGLCFRPRYWPWMVFYFVLRSGLLMTIEAPEARYTLECFPMLVALGGIGLFGLFKKLKGRD